MRKFIAKLIGIFATASRCSAECPTCGEACILGVHGTGGHCCGNGHNWGQA